MTLTSFLRVSTSMAIDKKIAVYTSKKLGLKDVFRRFLQV